MIHDIVKILYNRYIKGNPKREESLRKERQKLMNNEMITELHILLDRWASIDMTEYLRPAKEYVRDIKEILRKYGYAVSE